jgi:tyrosine-protein phosphatase YwqE
MKIERELIPTYNTVKINNKKKRVRYFGTVILKLKNGQIITLEKSGYMFIKNEPKTIYTYEP